VIGGISGGTQCGARSCPSISTQRLRERGHSIVSLCVEESGGTWLHLDYDRWLEAEGCARRSVRLGSSRMCTKGSSGLRIGLTCGFQYARQDKTVPRRRSWKKRRVWKVFDKYGGN
jgi:hypothetical protein